MGLRVFWGTGRVTGGCEQVAPWTEAQLWQTHGGGQIGDSQRVLKMSLEGGELGQVWDVLSPQKRAWGFSP